MLRLWFVLSLMPSSIFASAVVVVLLLGITIIMIGIVNEQHDCLVSRYQSFNGYGSSRHCCHLTTVKHGSEKRREVSENEYVRAKWLD